MSAAPPNDPPQQDLDRLVDAFQRRDMAQVEALGTALAGRFPSSAATWKVLGTARLVAGRHADAAGALQRAVALAPKDADLQVNLGNAFAGMGRQVQAEQHLLRALKLDPGSAVAFASLGNLLRTERRTQEARAAYEAALKLQPALVAARQNLAVLLADAGEFAQAEGNYREVVAAQPALVDAWVNLATLLQNTGRVREAQEVLSQGLRAVPAGQWMLASLAITGCWMSGDTAGAAQLFNAFQAQAASAAAAQQDRALREFFMVSARLFDFAQRQPELYAPGEAAPLVVIGESHSLVPAHARFEWVAGPVRAQARLVQGVKMHHLRVASPNGRQAAIRLQLQSVAPGSHVMLTIGEIDCRADEGIWPAHKAGKGACAYLVRNTVGAYLDWVAAHVATGPWGSLTVQGIPQPRRVPADAEAFLAMVADVNARLAQGCAARGWHFLDVHAATAGAQGQWHLDEFHLKPAFYARAGEYLRRP